MSVKMLKVGVIVPQCKDSQGNILDMELSSADTQQSPRVLLSPEILPAALPGQAGTPGSILKKGQAAGCLGGSVS